MPVVKNTFKLFFKFFIFALTLLAILALVIIGEIPTEKTIRGCLQTKMYKVDLCPTSGNYVRLNQISPILQKAILVNEDAAFYQHQGFDFHEIEKSFKTNLEKGKLARGGSTISQQLAKNLFLSPEKTFYRKALEALITVQLEKHLSKREIFEKYLNVVQFGKNTFGVKAASNLYFKKHPSELSATEAAFLAILLPNPVVYSKSFYKKGLTKFARKRVQQTLGRLAAVGSISQETYNESLSQLDYFLTGQEPPAPDVEIDSLDEEAAETLESFD